MDVKTAFLNSVLENDIFIEVPKGIEGYNELKSKYICKLQKALYGLRVSPKRWYKCFKETMLELKFSIYPFQTCIFYWTKGKYSVIAAMYVDDLLIIGNNSSEINNLKFKLSQVFEFCFYEYCFYL